MPTTTIPDHEIRYRTFGEPTHRPPLVAIHGAAGGLYVWLEQRSLAADRQLVLLDLPGHGQSAPEPEQVDIPAYAGHVLALADALEMERFVPLAHSMGGAIALTLALEHPARVAALVLLATGARLPVSDFLFGAIDGAFDQLGQLMAQVAYSPKTEPALVERYTRGPLQASQRIAREDFQACHAFDVRDRLSEIAAPTLILAGEEDQLIGAGHTRQLAAGIPGSRLVTIPGAGHMLMQERADAVNATIGDFLGSASEA